MGGATYSLDEQVVGTWIDGKPIYQKTIQDTMPTVTANGGEVSKAITFPIINIESVIEIKGVTYNPAKDWWFMLNTPAWIDRICFMTRCDYIISTNTFNITSNWNMYNGWSFYATMFYTKTMD